MTKILPNVTLSAGVPTAITGTALYVKGFILSNESGLSCVITMGGMFTTKNLAAGVSDYFKVLPGYDGTISIQPNSQLTNIASWPSSYMGVDQIDLADTINESQYPLQLPTRQTTTPTTSGNPIFSATIGFGSTVNGHQVLNVFNPQNSGVNLEVHSARVFTSGNQVGMASCLEFNSGPDNLYGTPVTIASHSCSSTPPASVANATGQDDTLEPQTTILEVLDTQQNATLDFLLFPDKATVSPGNNITILYGFGSSVTAGTVVRLTLKWTEVPLVVTPTTGGTPTPGNILTAANVVNDGNAPGTGVIAAYPLADGVNALFADNQGNLVLGSLQRNGDFQVVSANLGGTIFHIRALDNTIFMDGVQPFPGDGFTFHSEDGTNQIHVVDSGATFSNAVILSGGANANTIRDNVNGNTAIDLSAGTGKASFPKGIVFPVGSISQINTITVSVTTTPTAHAHGLTVAPTGYGYIFTGTGTTAGSLQVSSIGATNVTLTASGSFTAIITFYAA